MITLHPTPDRLVEQGRVAAWGYFDTPFRHLNLAEADIYGLGRLGSPLTALRLKEWQHYALVGSDFLLAFVVFNSHYLGMSFCHLADRRDGLTAEHHRQTPAWMAKVARELYQGETRLATPGYRVEIDNRLDQNRHIARIDIKGNRRVPGIRAEIEMIADWKRYRPLIAVWPIAENRPFYTHKMACPVKGVVRCGDRAYTLDERKDVVLVDVHKAFYPYQTWWKWITCAGYDEKGRLIGVNMTQNIIPNPDVYNENVLWMGERITGYNAAHFTMNPDRLLDPWRIETADGRANLTFTPQGERTGKVQAGVLSSDYHQPFGLFNGTLVDDEGETHVIRDFFGVGEYHKARF